MIDLYIVCAECKGEIMSFNIWNEKDQAIEDAKRFSKSLNTYVCVMHIPFEDFATLDIYQNDVIWENDM